MLTNQTQQNNGTPELTGAFAGFVFLQESDYADWSGYTPDQADKATDWLMSQFSRPLDRDETLSLFGMALGSRVPIGTAEHLAVQLKLSGADIEEAFDLYYDAIVIGSADSLSLTVAEYRYLTETRQRLGLTVLPKNDPRILNGIILHLFGISDRDSYEEPEETDESAAAKIGAYLSGMGYTVEEVRLLTQGLCTKSTEEWKNLAFLAEMAAR
jgi:hypothetical protein